MGTGKVESNEENRLLCKAYIRASEDLRFGTDRKKFNFSKAVLSHYNSPVEER